MTPDRLSYTFGPLERRGLLGGLRGGQVVSLAAGAILAIAALDRWPTAAGAVTATIVFLTCTAIAVWPLGHRTLQEWAPLALSFLWRRMRRRTRFRSAAPVGGSVLGAGGFRVRPAPPHPPPALRDI